MAEGRVERVSRRGMGSDNEGMRPMRPVAVIVRDGWGLNARSEGNAVEAARTPVIDGLKARYPWTRIACSGEAVGLPAGYQGSSEVGHLNMGAGRVVVQELKRIDDGLRSGELFRLPKWQAFVEAWRRGGGRLHLLGLLQDEGVHAHQEHLFKILRRARADVRAGDLVHPFLDGRDTPSRSGWKYLARSRPNCAKLVMRASARSWGAITRWTARATTG